MTTIAVGLILGALFWLLRQRERRRAPPTSPKDPLDAPLMFWSPKDPFTQRDLLRSVCVMGSSGSVKTSGVGFQIGRALAAREKLSMLIFASKPEDRKFWQSIAGAAGKELITFAPGEPHRFNFMDFESRHANVSARELTQSILIAAETLTKSEGGTTESFWKINKARVLQNGIEPLLQAYGKLDLYDLQRFITDAAKSLDQFVSEEWKAGYHHEAMGKAYENCNKRKVEGKAGVGIAAHDLDVAFEFWGEWAAMNDRTRSSILADVMATLFVYNTGEVKELIGTTTTISPDIFEQGAWVFVDAPVANFGAAGSFIMGAWKLSAQKFILRRAATETTPTLVIWADEYQNVMSSFDAPFLAECRSHRAAMIVLTQSIHSFFSSIGGKDSHSQTKALLTNFGTKIFTALGDEESAKFASSHISRTIIRLASSSRSGVAKMFNEFSGNYNLSTSLNESISERLLPGLFMNGLKTGGPENGCIVTAWVIRNGESFSNGENAMLVGFSQK